MSDPATIIGLIGLAVSAATSVASAAQQSKQAKAQQATSNYNAEIALREAKQARLAAAQDAADLREETVRRVSTANAIAGASGRVTTEGSSLLTAQTIAEEGEIGALRRLYSGEVQATGQQSQANLDRFNASSFAGAASSATFSGLIGVGSSLLTGASQSGLFNSTGSTS